MRQRPILPAFMRRSGCLAVLAAATALPQTVHAQLRVVSYNVARLNGDNAALADVISALNDDDKPGFAVAPHVYVVQEVGSDDLSPLLSILNAAAPAGVNYAAATYTNDGENGVAGAQALFYRDDVLGEIPSGHIDLATGAGRNTDRWLISLDGYDSPDARFYVYGSHLKAGNSGSDESQRLSGAETIRNNADALPDGTLIIYAGDFNLYSNGEPAYAEFLSNGNGQAIDPLGSGSWGGSGFAIKHTQSPRAVGNGLTGGGLDDRFDFQLSSEEFHDGNGLDIMAGTYRSLGNDGNHYNVSINDGNNSYYPGEISRSNALADALHDGSDHIPVVAEYRFPALLMASGPADIGRVIEGGLVEYPVTVENGAPAVVSDGAATLVWQVLGNGSLIGSDAGSIGPLDAPATATLFVNTISAGPISGDANCISSTEGAADGPVIVSMTGTVIRPSVPTLAAGQEVTELEVPWSLDSDTGVQNIAVDVYNLGFDAQQATLDLDGANVVLGDVTLQSGLASGIGAGSATLTFAFDTDGVASGSYDAELTIDTSDEDLPGEGTGLLTVTFALTVGGGGPIPGDVDGDGDVDFADLVELLASWGPCKGCPADFDGNGDVDFNDLVTLLSSWS